MMGSEALLIRALLCVVLAPDLLASQFPDHDRLSVNFTSLFDQSRVYDATDLRNEPPEHTAAIRWGGEGGLCRADEPVAAGVDAPAMLTLERVVLEASCERAAA